MSRLIPTCFTIMVFSAFLVGQIIWDKLDIEATPSQEQSQKRNFYLKNLKSIKGRSVDGDLIDLSKTKPPVVILNFWASWCLPCLDEFPSLVALKKKYKKDDEVTIVGINTDTENIKKNIKKIYKKYKLNFPSLLDEDKWSEKFRVHALPVSIIYLGNEVVVSEGSQNFMDKKFLKKVEKAIQESR
ncbi:MAG: TlpA disulfide reductase family protein [Bacteriovoracales bacterium]|nr:TlpA disulfide reductase family protein [Bacteriovoracales bacterium]